MKLLRAHETFFAHQEKGIVLALCNQVGPKGECDRKTEQLCWLHEETRRKGWHLICGSSQDALDKGLEHFEKMRQGGGEK